MTGQQAPEPSGLRPPHAACFTGTISGRVQGVGFRAFIAYAAEPLGISGWVRNLPDGRVQFAARGAMDRLEMLAVALKKGPPGAHVDALELDWSAGPDNTEGFEIRT
jgi:acylphosphatase